METKILEIRDNCTFIPVLAIAMVSSDPKDNYLLSRSGYVGSKRLILLIALTTYQSDYVPEGWRDRTYQTAHAHIMDHWDEIESADVIDVEFILGETDHQKTSERLIHLSGRDEESPHDK